jgi:Holliday junction resolvase RusA-like endonuclease
MPAPTSDLFDTFVEWMGERCDAPLLHLRVDAEPAPESLRIGRNRVFPGKLYAAFQAECVRQLAGPKVAGAFPEGPLVVALEVVCTRPKTSKREWPRGDIDNHAKGPLDALTKVGAWTDDDQVTVAYPVKRYARSGEEPGVNIVIGRLK